MNTSIRKTSLRGLRTFCVAAQHTSFRSAADELFVTASAVSHQVKNLEEEFDLKLFDRSGRKLQLTAAGQALYDDVSPLIAQLDEVTTRHRNLQPRSTLRISVQPFFASELFVPRLPDFRRRHPDIEIKVDTSDESSEKHPAGYDVSIRVFKSPPKSMPSDRLFALRLIPAASAEFRDKVELHGRKIRGDFPVIVHESRPRAWADWQRESGIRVPAGSASIRLDSMIAVARAAERGLGAALVPLQLSDSWFDTGALVKLFPEELPTDDAYYLVCRKEDEDNENVKLLRSWVLSQFGDI
jgi:LysR family glycine cleavage system transcriptional activator